MRALGLVLALGLGGCSDRSAAQQSPTTLLIHRAGVALEVDAGSIVGKALIEAAESTVAEADAVLRLAAGEAALLTIRQGLALEVRYSSPRTIEVPKRQRTDEFDRLLIPLTGELAVDISTVFFGKGRFESGPLRSPRPVAELREQVESVLEP
jgi:hypothetical protein